MLTTPKIITESYKSSALAKSMTVTWSYKAQTAFNVENGFRVVMSSIF